MSFPMADDVLIALAVKYGARDARFSEGLEGLDEDALSDVADDAWFHSGWMEFENHPELEDYPEEMSAKSAALKLSTRYIEAFVAQAMAD